MFAAIGSTITHAVVVVQLGHDVVGHDAGVANRAFGHAVGAGQTERGDAAATLGEKEIPVAVVVAGELHDRRDAR